MATALYGMNGYNGAVLSDQLAVTAANSGSLQVNNFGGSVVRWVSDTTFGGTWAVEFTNTANNSASNRWPFTNPSSAVGVAYEFTCPALPADSANPLTILTLRDQSTGTSRVPLIVQLLNTGRFNVLAGATGVGTGQASLPAPKSQSAGTPAALVPGTRYRLEVTANATTQVVGVRISTRTAAVGDYIGEALSDPQALPAIGTFTFTHADVGLGSYPVARSTRIANIRMVDGSSAYPGPYVASTPGFAITAVFIPDEATGDTTANVTVTRVANTGTGNTMRVSMIWGDGATTPSTLAPGGTLTLSHLYTNPSARVVYNWRADATLDT